MNASHWIKRLAGAGLGAAAVALAGCADLSAARVAGVTLSGAEEVPPVMTSASGSATFAVYDDRRVAGSVTILGLSPVAAHIHTGARGKNGPVAIGLTKVSSTRWEVPAGAKFTEDQYKAFLAGETYVNFHTAAHKGGEIRAQLQP